MIVSSGSIGIGSEWSIPSFVGIKPFWKYAVQICAGADEQQDHEEESLELENPEHCDGVFG